jgi:hypothetical protein
MIYCGSGSGSSSGSYFGKILVPAPVPFPASVPVPDPNLFSTVSCTVLQQQKICTKSCLFNARSSNDSQKVGPHNFCFLTFVLNFVGSGSKSGSGKRSGTGMH